MIEIVELNADNYELLVRERGENLPSLDMFTYHEQLRTSEHCCTGLEQLPPMEGS